MGVIQRTPLLKVDKQTIFINESGLYSFILNSKKREAKIFKNWITKEVLPNLRKNGSYTITKPYKPINDSIIITDYENTNVIYIAYIGQMNNEHVFKYGITKNILQRVQQHKAAFPIFELCFIQICDNNKIIETKFQKELEWKHIHRKINIKEQMQTELFTINEKNTYEDTINLLIHIMQNNKPPIIQKLQNKILELAGMLVQAQEDEQTMEEKHEAQLDELRQSYEYQLNLLNEELNKYKLALAAVKRALNRF